MQNRKAFTLLELMISILIIGILIALLVPSALKARENAKRVLCAANLKGIGTGIFTYAANNDGIIMNGVYYSLNPLSYWPEELVLDGAVRIQTPLMTSVPPTEPCWATGRSVFHCPSAALDIDIYGTTPTDPADDNFAGNATYGIGYYAGSILWASGSPWGVGSPVPVTTRHLMRIQNLNTGHIVAADAVVGMYRKGSLTGYNQGDIKQRHFGGANYMMGDGHVEWSDQFQKEFIDAPESIWRHDPTGIRGYFGG